MTRKPRIAINGFGRIGRLAARALLEGPDVEIVAINDLAPTATLAHLLKYDSVHGRLEGVVAEDDALLVQGQRIRIVQEPDPERLPWKDLDVDVVLECTGRFTRRTDLEKHLRAGAKKVVLSAPPKDPVDAVLVLGVNEHDYDPRKHHIVSNASCTTNCLAPVLKVLHAKWGIEHALMTTVHAYTQDQQMVDGPSADLRRARAAALSLVPTSTGAARAIGAVLPELDGKVDGLAVRVPTPNVSLVDVTATLGADVDAGALLEAFEEAAAGDLQGILRVEHAPLVSVDFNHDPHSAVIDAQCTMAIGGRMVKVLAWYDNEWGYASRMAELAHFVHVSGRPRRRTRPGRQREAAATAAPPDRRN